MHWVPDKETDHLVKVLKGPQKGRPVSVQYTADSRLVRLEWWWRDGERHGNVARTPHFPARMSRALQALRREIPGAKSIRYGKLLIDKAPEEVLRDAQKICDARAPLTCWDSANKRRLEYKRSKDGGHWVPCRRDLAGIHYAIAC